jgi:Cu2+-exporting ATPase
MSARTGHGTGIASAIGQASGRDARAARSCRHCGAPLLDARMRESGFCCAGCGYVFRLVHEHGLEGYYRIKDEVTAPADSAVFQRRDYAWLDVAQREAEQAAAGSTPELSLHVQGISCAGCVWLIDHVFQQQPGARDVFVNAQYGSMRLRWIAGRFSAPEFARKLQAFGYAVGPAGEVQAEPESRRLAKRIGLCAAFAMNVMLFAFPTYFGMERTFQYAPLFGLLAFAFGTLSLLAGGSYFVGRAIRALRERVLHIDLPISIGIVGAYSGSLYGWLVGDERFVYFDFVSAFILLMLIGRWAQVAAVERNQRRLLASQSKPEPIQLADGSQVSPEKITVEQVFLLGCGQILPVEARLETDAANVSLASINGEAEPKGFHAGQKIPAGAVNVGRCAVKLRALQPWSESLLARLTRDEPRPGWRHAFMEKIVRGYSVGILLVAALSGAAWLAAGSGGMRAGAVVVSVLVVSCPCAIALAFPLVDEIATVALRRRGVFVRDGDLWARLGQVRDLVFDKTGTLTLEMPGLKNPEALTTLDAEARAALLALVRDNPHPVSMSLAAALLADGARMPLVGEVREEIGWGAELDGWSLGRPGWRTPAGGSVGATVFARDGRVLAEFYFEHALRPGAREELAALRKRGLRVNILSGDSRGNVDRVAQELQVSSAQAFSELSPQDKAAWFDTHGANQALMLGDGANDSLAFDRALCRGTPVVHRGVLEKKADFYYLGNGLDGIRALFEIDVIRRRTQLAVAIFSVAYNLFAVGLAVAGKMNPLIAAALMPINSLLTLSIVGIGMKSVRQRT